MDYLYFLRNRSRFIRMFYDEAAAPFVERKRKIEAAESPFDSAPGYEDSEPPFLEEWLEADEALEVLGHMCISPLASTLQLYVREWLNHRTRGSETAIRELKAAFKQGWINGYRVLFRDHLGIDWATGPSDLRILEEIVLARNASQHPDSITTLQVRLPRKHGAQYPRSFFADDFEVRAWSHHNDAASEPFWPIKLNVTRDKLLAAIGEVERFCEWLNQQTPQFASTRLMAKAEAILGLNHEIEACRQSLSHMRFESSRYFLDQAVFRYLWGAVAAADVILLAARAGHPAGTESLKRHLHESLLDLAYNAQRPRSRSLRRKDRSHRSR